MKATRDIALLAPVPLEHLESGYLIARAQGFVAFGTEKWELLRRLDEMREGAPVRVLIYPSHESARVEMNYRVCWFGLYIGHVQGVGGKHPDGMKHRPPTTAQDGGTSAFWHVQGLRKLSTGEQLPISKVPTLKGGWRKTAPPHGPELVGVPESLSFAK